MTKRKNRIYFYISDENLIKLDEHLKKWSTKYTDRTDFINRSIHNLITSDENDITNLNEINDEIKHMKSLIEMNLQYVNSIIDVTNADITSMYYGDTMNAIKVREVLNRYYKNKKMNENKNEKPKKDVEEKENKSINRYRI